ncbi:hypothetical protein BXZ70DRAFT_925519 [Cristinia sonorae]|uniref:Uncharacterized protein n=1 Tax=Cristinia sonorae TaxID=1940300 RepID=A0A8K0UU57_9AGAR|nr:hypothetical protein BXZ70DRAFT_925519 [Cristinia sonorae]
MSLTKLTTAQQTRILRRASDFSEIPTSTNQIAAFLEIIDTALNVDSKTQSSTAYNTIAEANEEQFKLKIQEWIEKNTEDVSSLVQSVLDIRRTAQTNVGSEKPNTAIGHQATVKGFRESFRGKSHEALYQLLCEYLSKKNHYARYTSIIQSSGTGKSRTAIELGKLVLEIYLCLAPEGSTVYPPPDVCLREWLLAKLTQKEVALRMQAYIYASLVVLRDHLSMVGVIETPTTSLEQFRRLAAKLHSEMTDEDPAPRQHFFDKVLTKAIQFENAVKTQQKLELEARQKQKEREARQKQEIQQEQKEQSEEPVQSAKNDTTPVISCDNMKPHHIRDAWQELEDLLHPAKDLDGHVLVVFVFDEARHLFNPKAKEEWSPWSELRRVMRALRDFPAFSIFLSTEAMFSDLSPPPDHDPSGRIQHLQLNTFQPFVGTGLDHFADPIAGDDSISLDEVVQDAHMVTLGRPMVATRYKCGDNDVRSMIVPFCAEKVVGCAIDSIPVPPKLSQSIAFACGASRLPLDFRADSLARKEEERQVKSHMRICLGTTAGGRHMVTTSPSEPMLAEGSIYALTKCGSSLADALCETLNSTLVDVGERGELLAALLLLLASDNSRMLACSETPQPPKPEPDGPPKKKARLEPYTTAGRSSTPVSEARPLSTLTAILTPKKRIISVVNFLTHLLPPGLAVPDMKPSRRMVGDQSPLLKDAFATGKIWFNHFIKVADFSVVTQDFLWGYLVRGAAIICANNMLAVDIIIPVLINSDMLSPRNVTCILIQVKNDGNFQTTRDHLFVAMDPYDLRIFGEDTNPLPVIRMVFALASHPRHSCLLKTPNHHGRLSSNCKNQHAFYDIWVGGCGPESFGVIEPSQAGTFMDLLKRSQEGYLRELLKNKTIANMYPGGGASVAHWENFIKVAVTKD